MVRVKRDANGFKVRWNADPEFLSSPLCRSTSFAVGIIGAGRGMTAQGSRSKHVYEEK